MSVKLLLASWLTRALAFEPVEGYEYAIEVAESGKQLHANDIPNSDLLISTRYQSHDAYAKFYFESVDGGAYRIRVLADDKMIHADDEGSYSVSTMYQGDDDYNHFLLEGTDGEVTIRTKASSRAWTLGTNKLVATTDGDSATLFKFVKLQPHQICSAKRDCNYNGDCLAGSCSCFAQWKGKKCNVMSFVPTTRFPKTALASLDADGLQVSSWGGSVLRHDDGSWHMWAAEMANGTGIKSWITNSQVVHAVANGPLGPWKRQETVFPVFAHEPTVARAPSGEYVMYFTGGGPAYGDKEIPCTGKSCFGHNGTSDLSCPNDQQCTLNTPLLSRMSFASSPNGPWSKPVLVPSPSKSDTNLAHVIFKNGSMFGLGRPGHYWASSDWRDLSKYVIGATSGDLRGEDPMVWIDEFEGESILHAVLHGGGWSDPYGFHYFSEDGGRTWYGDNSVKTYENVIEYVDAPAISLSRRERPHMILGGTSGRTPVALSAGVTEAWPCALIPKPVPGSNGTHILCPVDYCYTLVQELSTSSSLVV